MNLSPDKPIAGLLAPLFALRSEDDLGIGDVGSLRQFVDWAASQGFGLIQLLPINETGNDNSPYNAISSVAIEPSTLVVSPEAIPDLDTAGKVETSKGSVDYPAVKKLKRALLEKAFHNFSKKHLGRGTVRAGKFRAFAREEAAWLESYAFFRALMDENGGSEAWDAWPEKQRTLQGAKEWLAQQKPTPRRTFEWKMRFFMYVQWLAFSQWKEMHDYCSAKNVALMGDVPYGISLYSADVFSQREIFDLQWSGGAPPEPYFKDDQFTQKWGQNWGMPLYRWDVMRTKNYAWWRRRVRMVREIFHLFRIDHILGFYRIYSFPWRPQANQEFLSLSEDQARGKTGGKLPHFLPRDDSTSHNRHANCREGEEYLRALVEETGEHRLIGEDLGMVPDYVRPNLTKLGIAGFKIPMWEGREDGSLVPGSDYQRLSVATYATHDHDPLRRLWTNWASAAAHGDGGALHEMRRLAGFAQMQGAQPQPWSDAVHEQLLRALFQCNSWIAVCMITDLFATEQRFNVPGAVASSNWSERLPRTVEGFKKSRTIRAKMEAVRTILAECGRERKG